MPEYIFSLNNLSDKTPTFLSDLETYADSLTPRPTVKDVGGMPAFIVYTDDSNPVAVASGFASNFSSQISSYTNWAGNLKREYFEDETVTSFADSQRYSPMLNAYIDLSNENLGKHVDIVILDDSFLVNSELYFGNRLQYLNWYEYVNTGSPNEGKEYPRTGGSAGHAQAVAGCATARNIGLASQANIFSFTGAVKAEAGVGGLTQDDIEWAVMILNWHRSKPINPETGHKNPTVIPASFGLSLYVLTRNIKLITNEGVGGFSGPGSQLRNFHYRGVNSQYVRGSGETSYEFFENRGARPNFNLTSSSSPVASDLPEYSISSYAISAAGTEEVPEFLKKLMDDLASEPGIFLVCAAGNDDRYLATPDDPDYDNYLEVNNAAYPGRIYTNRPGYPAAASGAFIIGGLSNGVYNERAMYSNFGPAIDVYAPSISPLSISMFKPKTDIVGLGAGFGSKSFRNWGVNPPVGSVDRHVLQFGGTSAAAPFVAGAIANYLSNGNYGATHAQVRGYIRYSSSTGANSMYSGSPHEPYTLVNHGGDPATARNSYFMLRSNADAYYTDELQDNLLLRNPDYNFGVNNPRITFSNTRVTFPNEVQGFHEFSRKGNSGYRINIGSSLGDADDRSVISFIDNTGDWFNMPGGLLNLPGATPVAGDVRNDLIFSVGYPVGYEADNDIRLSVETESVVELETVSSGNVACGMYFDWTDSNNHVGAEFVVHSGGTTGSINMFETVGGTKTVLSTNQWTGQSSAIAKLDTRLQVFEDSTNRMYLFYVTDVGETNLNNGNTMTASIITPSGLASHRGGVPGIFAGGDFRSDRKRNAAVFFTYPVVRKLE